MGGRGGGVIPMYADEISRCCNTVWIMRMKERLCAAGVAPGSLTLSILTAPAIRGHDCEDPCG